MSRFERHGVLGSEVANVFFTEASPAGGRPLGPVKATSNRQNRTLDQLKLELARQVEALGGNCCADFAYGQKATVLSFSSVQWNATGTAVRIG